MLPRLLPCVAWYDSTHVASCAYYRRLFAACPGIGGFIESKLGPAMVDDFAALGCAAALDKWRAYLYDDGDEQPAVGHLNGSSALPLAKLDAEYAGNPGRTGTVGRRWKPAGAPEASTTAEPFGSEPPADPAVAARVVLTIAVNAERGVDLEVSLS